MSATVESGGRRKRIEFAREAFGLDYNVLPTDPTFNGYSSTINNTEWSVSGTWQARRGLGDVDPTDHLKGPEEHELTVAYDLEQFFVTAGGDALDASYDGLARTIDNLLPNSHTVVEREEKDRVRAGNTVSGNTSRGTRTYAVGQHGKIGGVTITGDPSDSQPIAVELTYQFEKARTYQIDQPDTGTLLALKSTDAADTGLSVRVEDEGGATAETVALDGTDATTLVSTSNTYDNIDAVEVKGAHDGDVVVAINAGDATTPAKGDTLAEIHGANEYEGVESDKGVPTLDAGGSAADYAALGTPEQFIGDRLLRATDPVAFEVNSAELTVSNNLESTERASGFGMHITSGNRETSLAATVFGETEGPDAFVEHLRGVQADMSWELDGGDLELPSAVLNEPGSLARESGQAVATVDNTFVSQGINFIPA